MTRQKRWFEHQLVISDRRKTRYEYYVTGRGPFPIDMLRHDCAWPAAGEDAAKIEWGFTDNGRTKTRSIRMRSYRAPALDRWSSFGWSVGTENLETNLRAIADEVEAAEREFRPSHP